MKNPIIVNITELKRVYPAVEIKGIREDLESIGAEVLGTKDENGNVIMVIDGNVDYADIEAAFDEVGISVEDYVIDDDDYIPNYDDLEDDVVLENDGIPAYDEVEECGDAIKNEDLDECGTIAESKKPKAKKTLNEKKKGCCPPKKANNTVSLQEALGTKTEPKKYTLNEVIDSICGISVAENVKKNAIAKALKENQNSDKMAFLHKKLGAKKFKAVCEALENGSKSLANCTINGKGIAEYTTEELSSILEKVNKQITELEAKAGAEGLNEGDSAKIQKTLDMRRTLAERINDEIDFRNAIKEAAEDEAKDPFGDVAKVPTGVEEADDNKEDEKPAEEKTDDEEKASDEDEKTADDEQNPDEDETVELSQIVVTLASKDAAEDLKQDLLDAGVPEEAIEIEKAAEDEEETEEETPAEDEEKSTEEEKPAEEKKAEESVKTNGKKINEADDTEEEKPAEDETAADNAEEEKAESDETDEAYKLVLTDTEYAGELATVLQDIWGMPNDEFNKLIGGELVSDETNDEDADNTGDDETEDDQFSAEDIFKGL